MNFLHRYIDHFIKNDEGSQSVELVLMAPLLVWTICATLAFTDAFRTRAVAAEAVAVIADTLSRQTNPIDDSYLDGLASVAGKLTGYEDDVSIRVSQVYCDRNCENTSRRLKVAFSEKRGVFNKLHKRDLRSGEMRERIPNMSLGDRIILVETSFTHKPIMNVGLKETEVEMHQATRMRFAPQLCWNECNP